MLAEKVIPRWIAQQMTGIEWTDFSGNGWTVCTRMAASHGALSACEICYAATFAESRLGLEWGPSVPRHPFATFAERMRRIDRAALRLGLRFAIFCNSLSDWLDAEADPVMRGKLIDVVESCPNVNWLLLTHRPHLAKKLLPSSWRSAPPDNVWAGTTIEHPAHAFRWDQHAEYWGHTGRAWVSAEPLASSLAGIKFDGAAVIIMGGASNTRDPAWAFDSKWIEEGVEQWGEDRLFFKQHGVFRDGVYVGDKKKAGRDFAGRIYDNTPWPRHRDLLSQAA